MAKFRKNPRRNAWESAVSLFRQTLGAERFEEDITDLTLRFHLQDEQQLEQFELFGRLALNHRVQFQHQVTDAQSMRISLIIPHEGTDKAALAEVARLLHEDLQTRRSVLQNGEKHRAITPHDVEYPLAHLTGVPWRRTQGTPYGTVLVEPASHRPIDPTARDAQEEALGELLLPDKSRRVEVLNWQDEQRRIEEEKSLPPRMAIPSGWVTVENIARGEYAPAEKKAEARNMFK